MNMRAKMTIQSVTSCLGYDELAMGAVYSDSKEDNSYSEATPSGSIELCITNPKLVGTFKPGQQFFVDFTPVPIQDDGDDKEETPKE